jgi:hypothetical protein
VGLFSQWKARREKRRIAKQFVQSDAGRVLHNYSQAFFAYIPQIGQETRESYAQQLMEEISHIASQDNPFIAYRESLAGAVCNWARHQVVCLTETERAQTFPDVPFLSGELHRLLPEAAADIDVVKRARWEQDERIWTADEVRSLLNASCVRLGYIANGLDALREIIDDKPKCKDWFSPFTKAMLIWSESSVRSRLSEPSLFPSSDTIGLMGLTYSSFMNFVADGHAQPFMEFERAWMDVWPDVPHGLAPKG